MGFVTHFDLLTVLFGLIWIGIVTFLRLKKEKSLIYLIFFTIFYVYLFKVLDYTLFQITFRVADINDVIFNTVGVAVGYILFVGFVRIYRHISHNWIR